MKARRAALLAKRAEASYAFRNMENASAKPALLASMGLVAVGLVIAALTGGGLGSGSILGGLIAAGGLVPALYGVWRGMQQETQSGMAASLGVGFLSLAVAAALVLLAVVDWFR